MTVTRTLNEIEGIKDVKVDLEKAEASYREEKPVDMAIIRERIKQAGYEVVE
jgi:copper chaperone CopZ